MPKAIPPVRFVSVTEAARIIGITPGRVRQILRDNPRLGVKIGPRAWLVLRNEVEKIRKNPAATGRPRGSQNKDAVTT